MFGICWRSFRLAAEPTPSLLASGVGSSIDLQLTDSAGFPLPVDNHLNG
jgi:hypothetical protein